MKRILQLILAITLVTSIANSQHKPFREKSRFLKHNNVLSVASTRHDFFLTLSDGVTLDCTKFIPDENPPGGGRAAIIFCHGYGGSKDDDLDAAEESSGYGYYTLCYSMRGQGNSGGLSNLISTTEMNDFLQVLQYVRNDANINVNKIEAFGSSQGGIIPFMAACNGAQLRTILIDLASPEFATSWIENGCVKMSLIWSLSYTDGSVRYNTLTQNMRRWILASQDDKWDSLAYFMPQNRDFMNKVKTCLVPVLSTNAWQDKFFNCFGMLKARDSIHVPFRMYYGAGGHGADDSQEEEDYISNYESDWEDYWLNGENNHELDSNKYIYSATGYPMSGDAWSFYRSESPTWPPANTNTVNFYLTPGQKLKMTPNPGANDTASLFSGLDDASLTMTEAINDEFTGSDFDAKFERNYFYYETDPMNRDYEMVGTPFVNLFYSTGVNVCQFNFQIWDADQNNNIDFVSRINFTDRHYAPNTVKQSTFYGMSHSHIFKQGHKIRIYVTNLDKGPTNEFLGTNPHVLPVLKKSYNRIYMNSSHPSYVQLSFIGPVTIGVQNISQSVPSHYALMQNYPNPFNPTTKIKFDVASNLKSENSNVRLVIYDITGREIEQLVNENLKPGSYEAEWNASRFASGIYFYTLSSGSFIQTRKMVLIK